MLFKVEFIFSKKQLFLNILILVDYWAFKIDIDTDFEVINKYKSQL